MPDAATSVRQSDRDAAIVLAGKVTGIKLASIPDYDPYVQALALHREAETGDLLTALNMCRAIIKFHVKPERRCSFSINEGSFSALDAHDAAVAAIARATGAGA